MTVVVLLVVGFVLWVLKSVAGSLLGQQIKGSIPEYATRKATSAAQLLPQELAAEYLEEWLAELEALDDRPLSTLRFAMGLSVAARRIAAAAGAIAPRPRAQLAAVRFADILGSSFAITFFAPLLLMLALMIKTVRLLGEPGGVLVRIPTDGKHGRPFNRLRFDTGSRHSPLEQSIEVFGLADLPSLVNVLRGDMAFFGPRSAADDEDDAARKPGFFS
jgi:hypothetical protein